MTSTPEDVVVTLRAARATGKDPLDLPRTMTQRQINEYVAATTELETLTVAIPSEVSFIAEREARLAPIEASLDRLRTAEAGIDKLTTDAADWRTIADQRERDAEWAHQQALAAAKTTIIRGCEYLNGQPALPAPLRELLTDVCPHCHRAEVLWSGPIDLLEQQRASLMTTINQRKSILESHLRRAEQVLSEFETLTV